MVTYTLQQQPHAPPSSPWKFQGWGTSLCWFSNVLGSHPAAMQAICTLLFDRTQGGLGLNIVRYNIGASPLGRDAEFRPGAALPCVRQQEGEAINWGLDMAQLAFLQAARRAGADTVQAFCNSPPYFMTKSGSSKGARRPLQSNLPRAGVEPFAEFLSDVVAHMEDGMQIPVHSVAAFNEPSSPGWTHPRSQQEGCFFSYGRAVQLVSALKSKARLSGKLSLFDEFCVADSLLRVWCARLCRQWDASVKVVCTHTYNSTIFSNAPYARCLSWLQDNRVARALLRRAIGTKPLWVSEYGQGGAQGLASKIMHDLLTLRPEAWVYWQAVEEVGSSWGLLHAPLGPQQEDRDAVQVGAQFHVLKVFAEHLRPGACLFQLSNCAIGAYHPQNKTVSAVVVSSSKDTAVELQLPQGARLKAGRMDSFAGGRHAWATFGPEALTPACTFEAAAPQAPEGVWGVTFELEAACSKC